MLSKKLAANLRNGFGFAVLACALGLLLAPSGVWAQGANGTISATVQDASGAVVPAATVTLINTSTGDLRSTQTNQAGLFSFTAVLPGTYSLRVAHAGFSTYQRSKIVLHPADSISISGIVLKPGATQTTVEVSANAADIIPVDTGAKSDTIQAKEIQNLAIVGRNAIQLLSIIPGVTYSPGSMPGGPSYTGEQTSFGSGVGSFQVNGTRNDALAIVSDGADTIDPGCNCGSSVTPNVDAISEITVQTSNFSSDTNKGPVVIQIADKTGGSHFHGEIYDQIRNYHLNANDWQNNRNGTGRPQSNFQYPGFNIGGPILIPGTNFNHDRDKAFFFGEFEWMRQGVDNGLHKAFVPTPGTLQGDLTGDVTSKSVDPNLATEACSNVPTANGCTGAPGMLDPSKFDPAGVILLKQLPAPNADPALTGGYNYLSDVVAQNNRQQSLLRFDYNFTQNTKFYARYDHETEAAPQPYGLWWGGSTVPYPGDVAGSNHSNSLSLSLTNVLSPTMTNEMTAAFTRLVLPNQMTNPSAVSRKSLNYPYTGLYQSGEDLTPTFTDWSNGGTIITGGGFAPTMFANKWTNTFSDNYSWVTGNHLLKFGVFFEHLTNDQPTDANDMGQLSFGESWGAGIANWDGSNSGTDNYFGDMLMGFPFQFGDSTANITGHMRENEFDFYGQDSWKIRPNFTLDYGVRFYHDGWMYDAQGRLGAFVPALYGKPTAGNPYPGIVDHNNDPSIPMSVYKQPLFQAAPHLGWAWDLSGKGTRVLRGGFGMYYYRDQGNVFFGAIGNPPNQLNYTFPNPLLLSSITPAQQVAIQPGLTVLDPQDGHVPVTYSYSLTLSQRLPYATVMEISYVGNSSHNQVTPGGGNGGFDTNAVPEGTFLRAGCAPAEINNDTKCNENDNRPYNVFAGITKFSHILEQSYNSLQVTASRQTGNLNYSVAYTFSKNLGEGGSLNGANGVNPFDIRGRSYGVLNYDQTHVLSAAYNYLLPNFGTRLFGGNRIGHGVLNGWQFSGISQWRSGFPMLLQAGSGGAGIGDIFVSGQSLSGDIINGTPDDPVRPVLTCNPTANLAPHQVFNANCFQAPSPGRNGEYEMPYIHGPWYNNTDLSLFKNFPIGKNENRRLQLRFETFNFDNHPLWGWSSGDPGQSVTYPFTYAPDSYSIAQGKVCNPPADTKGCDQVSWGQSADNAATSGQMTQKLGHRIVQIAVKFFF
ncbi:MAG: carboxypeptidase regulatory-like domain-containing protein [Terriglobales bacterium]